jgi:hypothetical protein
VISHIVLFKPRPDLAADDRRALVAAFERAVGEIPSVRAVRIGARVVHGAGYERLAHDAPDYLAILDFDDLAGLRAYLDQLGTRFGSSAERAWIYDFEVGGVEGVATLDYR